MQTGRKIIVGCLWVAFFSTPLWIGAFWNPFVPSEGSSIRRYKAYRQAFPAHLVDHFPVDRPDTSADPIVRHFPGFLQGGGYLQLRVRTTGESVRDLDAELRGKTDHIYSGGSKYTHLNHDPENAVPTTNCRVARDDENAHEFPNHFTLYVLYAEHYSGGWNHGQTKGTAVSLKTNEVIFWAENW